MQRLLINKADLSNVCIQNQSLNIQDGEVLLKIDSFGLSANNITYAVLGKSFGYWGFFPAQNTSTHGVLPVWGFATVTQSKHADIAVGKRVFGYLPFASHVVIQASSANATGFMDTHPHRKSISPVYDQYLFCDTDPGYQQAAESWQITYRPLFMTSFVLADFVSSMPNSASTIILTSASSKTAYGTAMLFKHGLFANKSKIIGLTSSANKAFVESLGCYDQVIEYADIANINSNIEEQNISILDFAGNKQTLNALQQSLSQHKLNTLLIGATDVEGRANDFEQQADGEVFFAPSQVKLRQQEWGSASFFGKYHEAWVFFLKQVQAIIEEVTVIGFDNMSKQYLMALQGDINPKKMLILKPE